MLNYSESDDHCGGCGATLEDRKRERPAEAQGTWICPHCGCEKCRICDMGDDVECIGCGND